MRPLVLLPLIALLTFTGRTSADEPVFSKEEIRTAMTLAIPRIEAGSAGSAEQRTCFTCHSQALPILALTEAKRRGFQVDDTNLTRQLEHTLAHLERGKQKYLEGKGQGGRSITAGYALRALEVGGHKPDDTTAAVASYLLQIQTKSDHWSHPGNRPPTSGSDFTTTALALRGLIAFGTEEQQAAIDARVEVVRQWLAKTEPKDTEDRVFKVVALENADCDDELMKISISKLLGTQREDGGWSQTDEMESDAYATGTVVATLLQTDRELLNGKQIQQGIRFLLDTQCDDGSWHVVTRAKAFQEYYESGFPHEEDQFISIAASCWATMALALALPEPAPQSTPADHQD